MRMIAPASIGAAQLTSSSLEETEHAVWDEQASYQARDRVIWNHQVFEAAEDNTGKDPAEDKLGNWIKAGATNRFKAFDGLLSDPAVSNADINYTIRVGSIANAIAFFNVSASAIVIRAMSDSDGEIYANTISLIDPETVFDWYTYFFADIEQAPDALIDDIPPYRDVEFEITLEGDAPSIGQIVLGNSVDLGKSKHGTSVSFKDYSTKDRDDFGNAVVVERSFADVVDFEFVVETGRVRQLRKTIAARRAKPTVFYTTRETLNYGTLVYGFPGQLLVNLSGPAESDVTLDVEGLV